MISVIFLDRAMWQRSRVRATRGPRGHKAPRANVEAMKASATLVMLALTAVVPTAASAGSVTLSGSSLSFKQALSACPGALGSVTFVLGHSRVVATPGVSTQTDTTQAGIDTVTFSGNGKGASVVVNGHDRSVSGKHVQPTSRNQVACVLPD